MSRLVQCGGEALPEDSRDIFTSIEDIPALKWVFNELDKQQEFGNLVGAIAAADSDSLAGAPDAIKRFQERQVALQEFDASQRMDFDHLMAPVLPVATIQPVLDAITAMGLQLNYYTTGVF